MPAVRSAGINPAARPDLASLTGSRAVLSRMAHHRRRTDWQSVLLGRTDCKSVLRSVRIPFVNRSKRRKLKFKRAASSPRTAVRGLGGCEQLRYQSLPRTPPSSGTHAIHHVVTAVDGVTVRTPPSPSPASMAGWVDTATSQRHLLAAGVTWKGKPLGGTVRPELKSMPWLPLM